MAYGKWEIYPEGRGDLDNLNRPMDPADKEVDEFGDLRQAAHAYFCSRNGKIREHPHMLLALLVTLAQHRRQGAGSLIVKWGLDMSEATGLPCYVQASEHGRLLYTHYGFEDIDTTEFDLSAYRLGGVERMTEMIRQPTATRKHGAD